jgi:hypothetical protein
VGRAVTTWRVIPGFSSYVVSDVGTVAACASPGTELAPLRILAVRTNHGGYVEVKLFADYAPGERRRRVWRKVHTLVLEAFVGPRPSPRHHGAHAPDRDRTNNRLSNLSWKTPEENEADKREHGTKTGGTGAPRTTKRRVNAIRFAHSRGESISKIASRFGMHRTSVARIISGARHAPTEE